MKPVWTLDQITDNLARWNAAWSLSRPVDYSFYTSAPAHHGTVTGFSAFSPAQRAALDRIFTLTSDVCNLDFRQVANNGQEPGAGNERIGFLNVNSNIYKFTGRTRIDFTDPPGDTQGVIRGADIEINLHRANPRGGWAIGDWNFATLMHEAYHALGLQHPGEYNGDSGHQAGYDEAAEYMQDSGQYTVMSYWAASETGARWYVSGEYHHAATPLLHDIAALQALYGANMSTRAGDTTYGFNCNAGRASYDLARDPHLIFAIWDGGGRDTLDLSGYATASFIDLREGGFSNAGGMTKRFAIAHGAVVENAIGGRGNDTLVGNDAGNLLDGRAGADRLTGGRGNDVYLVDNVRDFAMEGPGADGTDTVRSSVAFTLGGGIENLVLLGSAHVSGTGNNLSNQMVGNSGANWLRGGYGSDSISGGAGNDVLIGGFGNDGLRGGSGFDLYILDAPLGTSTDALGDFFVPEDTIRLDRDVFTGIGYDGTLRRHQFVLGSAAQDADDRIIYDRQNGLVFYDADGAGGQAATLILWMRPGTELTAADFQAFI